MASFGQWRLYLCFHELNVVRGSGGLRDPSVGRCVPSGTLGWSRFFRILWWDKTLVRSLWSWQNQVVKSGAFFWREGPEESCRSELHVQFLACHKRSEELHPTGDQVSILCLVSVLSSCYVPSGNGERGELIRCDGFAEHLELGIFLQISCVLYIKEGMKQQVKTLQVSKFKKLHRRS